MRMVLVEKTIRGWSCFQRLEKQFLLVGLVFLDINLIHKPRVLPHVWLRNSSKGLVWPYCYNILIFFITKIAFNKKSKLNCLKNAPLDDTNTGRKPFSILNKNKHACSPHLQNVHLFLLILIGESIIQYA